MRTTGMYEKIQLALGIHSHQPVGNFDFVFKQACDDAYLPFLKKLLCYPDIKITVHFSGILFEWIRKNFNEIHKHLEELSARGQIEFLSGGFYEPVLATIPHEHKIKQIKLLSDYIKTYFNFDPKGLWLTERIWEPELPFFLSEAGINYCVVDDGHFFNAGLEKEKVKGYYFTESANKSVGVFPISEELRYLIPFKNPDEIMEYFQKASYARGNLITMIDDGEKFGIWPGTKKWVYKDGWIDKFFGALTKSDIIEPVLLKDYFFSRPPEGLVYLPATSYFEMGEWTLYPDARLKYERLTEKLKQEGDMESYKPFVRGGIFKNFFSRYTESRNTLKKAWYLTSKLEERKNDLTAEKYGEIQDRLFQAECNDAYWHGIFGGLYLPHLRGGVYENIIKAQKLLYGKPFFDETDFNFDGEKEILTETENLICSFTSNGEIFELCLKDQNINLLNTLTRRYETYHTKILNYKEDGDDGGAKSIHDKILMKEKNLSDYLIYDTGFLNFSAFEINADGLTPQKFKNSNFEKIIYGKESVEKTKDSVKLKFKGASAEKTFEVNANSLSVDLKSDTNGIASVFHLALFSESPDKFIILNGEKKDLKKNFYEKNVKELEITDKPNNLKIKFAFSVPVSVYKEAIYTVNQSESGFERCYQQTRLIFHTEGRWLQTNFLGTVV